MEVNSVYKQTDAGIFPEEWEMRRLGHVGRYLRGVNYDPNNNLLPYDTDYTKRILRANNVQGAVLVTSDIQYVNAAQVSSDQVLRKHDIVICMANGSKPLVGKAGLFLIEDGYDYTFGAFMGCFRTDTTIANPIFIFSLFQTRCYRDYINTLLVGSAINHLRPNSIESLEFPFPRLSEQTAIAEVLGDVDILLDSLDRLIAKKRNLKQATMQQLLTGQIRLPGFRKRWEAKRLGDHVTFLRNGVNSRAELLPEGRVRYIHYGDIHACRDSYLTPDSLPCLPEIKAARLDRLRDGDLILADTSEDIVGVGKSVEVRDIGSTEVVSGLHTIVARFDKTLLADGFKGYLQFCPTFATHVRRLAAGTKVYATNQAHIAGIEMKLPSVSEQIAIAAILSDMAAELTALEARRNKTHDLKQAMMQELLTGRTRLVSTGAIHV